MRVTSIKGLSNWNFWQPRAKEEDDQPMKTTQIGGRQYGRLYMSLDLEALYPAALWPGTLEMTYEAVRLKAERVWLLTSRIYAALHCASLGLCCALLITYH